MKQPADNVAHEQERDQHGKQGNGQRYDGEADLLGAAQRGFERVHAVFDIARDIFDHHDGIVDDEAGGDGQRHQRQIVEAEAQEIHRPERADDRQRHRQARNDGSGQRAQKNEDHKHHQHDRERQFEFDIRYRRADGHRAVAENGDVECLGQRGAQLRQQRIDAVDHLDDVGAGLALHIDDDRRRQVSPGGELGVFRAGDDSGDIRQPHRRAVAIGDDQGAILIGAGDLIIGIDGQRLRRAVEIALGRVDIEIAERGADVIDIEAIGGERLRIDLDAHGRPLPAADADEADARELRDFLREPRLAHVLDFGERQGFRGDGERKDRRVGRIDLAIDRRRRQVGRQQIVRRIDRRLHLLLGDIEAEIEIELQRNDRGAGGARRGHLVQPRHLPELSFERRRHRGRHHFRAGAGIKRLHLDGRIIHLGQSRQRQESVGDEARQQDRRHQERRTDRPQNEGFRDVHRTASPPRRFFCLTRRRVTGRRLAAAETVNHRSSGVGLAPCSPL